MNFSIVHAKAVDARKAYVRASFKDGAELLFHIQGKDGEFISATSTTLPIKMSGWAETAKQDVSVLKPPTEALQAYEVSHSSSAM